MIVNIFSQNMFFGWGYCCFVAIRLYSDGVIPVSFLKVLMKLDRDLNPMLSAIASMV
jgi:hypothetical protein